jgi:hypothetical protein
MKLCNLPLEIFRAVLAEMAITVGIAHAIRLRLVCSKRHLADKDLAGSLLWPYHRIIQS